MSSHGTVLKEFQDNAINNACDILEKCLSLIHRSKGTLLEEKNRKTAVSNYGNVLFEAFGHSAIRVKDPDLKMDAVYNYGLFDFNQPNFYLNFIKGKLIYKIGKQSFSNFLASYNYQKRWVKAQVLNLSQDEKQKMFQLLEVNSYPENANYLYDPYFNNCATKLRDITKEILGDQVQFPSSFSNEDYTMRQLMNKELPWNTWGNFGINLALGNTLDKAITSEEYMYLPDYVYKAFKRAKKTKNSKSISLIKNENILLNFKEKEIKTQWYNPFFVYRNDQSPF